MGDATFFSKHRKNTITLVNDKFPDSTEIIRFLPTGMIGMVTVPEEVAVRMRKHKLFESVKVERGTFYENKPAVIPDKGNIVQGMKGAGTVIQDNSTELPAETDEEDIVEPPKKKKKSTKKKNSKKK